MRYKLEAYGDPIALAVMDQAGDDVAYLTVVPVKHGPHANPPGDKLEGIAADVLDGIAAAPELRAALAQIAEWASLPYDDTPGNTIEAIRQEAAGALAKIEGRNTE